TAALRGCFFFFQAEDGIRDRNVTGVQTCALPISALARSCAKALTTSTSSRARPRRASAAWPPTRKSPAAIAPRPASFWASSRAGETPSRVVILGRSRDPRAVDHRLPQLEPESGTAGRYEFFEGVTRGTCEESGQRSQEAPGHPRPGKRLPRTALAPVPQGQGTGHPLAGLQLP